MRNLRLLKTIQKELTPAENFNGEAYGKSRPHCVIGELASILCPEDSTLDLAFEKARKLFTKKEYNLLNEGPILTYRMAHAVLRNAIRRHLKKESK